MRNIAICVRMPGETQAHAEKAVRKRLRLSCMQNHMTETEVLRDMWRKLKTGTPHQRLNEMVADRYVRPLTFAEFDRFKTIVKMFQKRARRWSKTREEALKGGEK